MVDWLAEGTDTTATLKLTRIDALSVDTRFVEATIGVRPTSHQTSARHTQLAEATILVDQTLLLLNLTALQCVSAEAFLAPTHRLVVDCHASSISATRLERTRVLANLIDAGHLEGAIAIASTSIRAASIETYLGRGTLVVRNTAQGGQTLVGLTGVADGTLFVAIADRQRDTLYLGIANVMGKAGTLSLVLERIAVSIEATGTAEVAWILALLSKACQVIGTVAVSTTTSETLRFDANMPDGTLLVRAALAVDNAIVVETRHAQATIAVHLAGTKFLRLLHAANRRVAIVVGWARTCWLVIDSLAAGILTTNIGKHARIDTLQTDAALAVATVAVRSTARLAFVVLADLIGTTVHINDALHRFAFDLGVARISGRTLTLNLVMVSLADCIVAAGGGT